MKIGTRWVGTLVMLAAVVTLLATPATAMKTVEIVKVYSEGKRIATYEAVEKGWMEGDCYVFKIRQRGRYLSIRVCGTFVVEEAR